MLYRSLGRLDRERNQCERRIEALTDMIEALEKEAA
jgi:hypothetical protein